MKVLDGYKYIVIYKGKEIKDIVRIVVDNSTVTIYKDYNYKGFNGGDCVGLTSSTYNKTDITVVRRLDNELHSKENKE